MAKFTFDYDTFSDMYKDAHGFRPRGHEFYAPETTDERRQEIWDYTYEQVLDSIAEDKRREAEGIERFNKALDEVVAVGARDRAQAFEWLRDAQGEGQDRSADYFEYSYDLPYGYLVREGFVEAWKPEVEAA